MNHLILINETEFDSVVSENPTLPLLVKGSESQWFVVDEPTVNNVLDAILDGEPAEVETEETNYVAQVDELLS